MAEEPKKANRILSLLKQAREMIFVRAEDAVVLNALGLAVYNFLGNQQFDPARKPYQIDAFAGHIRENPKLLDPFILALSKLTVANIDAAFKWVVVAKKLEAPVSLRQWDKAEKLKDVIKTILTAKVDREIGVLDKISSDKPYWLPISERCGLDDTATIKLYDAWLDFPGGPNRPTILMDWEGRLHDALANIGDALEKASDNDRWQITFHAREKAKPIFAQAYEDTSRKLVNTAVIIASTGIERITLGSISFRPRSGPDAYPDNLG